MDISREFSRYGSSIAGHTLLTARLRPGRLSSHLPPIAEAQPAHTLAVLMHPTRHVHPTRRTAVCSQAALVCSQLAHPHPKCSSKCLPGRGEPVRLALAALEVEWEECGVDYQQMKSDLEQFPFAQCPRWVLPRAPARQQRGPGPMHACQTMRSMHAALLLSERLAPAGHARGGAGMWMRTATFRRATPSCGTWAGKHAVRARLSSAGQGRAGQGRAGHYGAMQV